jgi:carbon-monoxide dehydrogenase small subunit
MEEERGGALEKVLWLKVNGTQHQVIVSPKKTLLEVLREDLGLTGTKHGCETGECGLCTVLLEGKPVLSCLLLASLCEGKEIVTIEGLGDEISKAIEDAFLEAGAVQCGYCTPSVILTIYHKLKLEPMEDPKDVLSGNLCRCTGYVKILEAYKIARERLGEKLSDSR